MVPSMRLSAVRSRLTDGYLQTNKAKEFTDHNGFYISKLGFKIDEYMMENQ